MIAAIDKAKEDGDTLGGIFEVVAKNVPVGLGAHTSWEDKLDGRIARAIMSIHAIKAVEIGTGVTNTAKRGSEVHDEISFRTPCVSGGQKMSPLRRTGCSLTQGFPTSFGQQIVREVSRAASRTAKSFASEAT